MPSWNIHIAHAERLLEGGGSVARVVRDRNAFLFGNLVPDIYVGYMVPAIERPIPYRITHVACPEHIPRPRERDFWAAYVAPLARELAIGDEPPAMAVIDAGSIAREAARVAPAHAATFTDEVDATATSRAQVEAFAESARAELPVSARRSLFDLVLGAWVHLLADTTWNSRVRDVLAARGEQPSRDFRIKKQGDFDLFGKSLAIDMTPLATARLLEVASAFPQYPIDERSALAAVAVAHETVRANHLNAAPVYQLLDEGFFSATFDEVQRAAEARIAETWPGAQ